MNQGSGRRLLEALVGAPAPLAGPDRMIEIPGLESPRWILPARLSSARTILGEWQPYKFGSRLLWKALMVAGRLNLLSTLPGVVCFDTSFDAIDWAPFGWRGRQSPLPLIYVGTASPHQKLVAILVDRTSERAPLIVKRALGPKAHVSLRREVKALSDMRDTHPNLAPEPLRTAPDFSFTVQSHLGGRSAPPALTPAHIKFLSKLAEPDERVDSASVLRILSERRDDLYTKGLLHGEELAQIDTLIDRMNGKEDMPATRVHGDFAPWNLKLTTDGGICAVDWEESRKLGLPYDDLAHYIVSCSRLLGKRGAPELTSRLIRHYGEELGIPYSTQETLWPLMLALHNADQSFPRADAVSN